MLFLKCLNVYDANIFISVCLIRCMEEDEEYSESEDKFNTKIASSHRFGKKWILILISAIIIVTGAIIFLLLYSSDNILSENALSQGTNIKLEKDDEIKFLLNDEEHTLKTNYVSTDYVDITLQSNPILANLTIGETKKFDLDDDAFYDIQIKLNDISGDIPEFYIKKINEVVCIENWSCSNWTTCINGTQTRTCEDLNSCGTDELILTHTCETEEAEILLSCSEQGGDECTPTQTCNAGLIEAYDTNFCCSENCEGPEQEINLNLRVACDVDLDCSNCGTNIDCFINDVCNYSKLVYDFTLDILGWVQSHSYYYEIRSLDEGLCIVYSEIRDVYGNYTDEKRQSLIDGGMTEEEVNQQIQDLNDALNSTIGYNGICKSSASYVVNYLNDLKEGTVDSEDPYFDNCIGTLYS